MNRCTICLAPEPQAFRQNPGTQGLVAIPTRFGPSSSQRYICAECTADAVAAWGKRAAESRPKPPAPKGA